MSALLRKFANVVAIETTALHLRRRILMAIARAVPIFIGNRLRTAILRSAGLQIAANSVLFGVPRIFGGSGPLVVGERVVISVGCTIELNDRVEIGDGAALGPDVMILTSSHRLGSSWRRAGEFVTGHVIIGSGAWIGARSVLLPGVVVEPGAVVSANSVINKNVAAGTVVAGVPAATVVKRLPG